MAKTETIVNKQQKGLLGEEAVNELAKQTYLSYWCYPDPKDENGNRKQICDLLILFRNTAIVLEVKNYQFNGDYEKYFRSTLKKATSQIKGAERKLFESESDIYIKHPSKGLLKFERNKYSSVQRVIVNLNTSPLFYPGTTITNKGDLVHVFNWDAFLRLVIELDTIPDFIQYLDERERTFRNKEIVLMTGSDEQWVLDNTGDRFHSYTDNRITGEKGFLIVSGNELDLLASYFLNNKKFNKYLNLDGYEGATIELDGSWNNYLQRKEVKGKKEADNISYFIDEIIKREILYKDSEQRLKMAEEFLSLSRFERRVLGKNFHDFIHEYKDKGGTFTVKRFGRFGELAIGFFLHSPKFNLEQSMNLMQIAAQGYSYWEGYKAKKVLIIGNNTKMTQSKFLYNEDVQPLSKQEEAELIHDLKLLNWFENIEKINESFAEYPEDSSDNHEKNV